jgi:tetratricopeptide (TPR) repeat protein
MKTKIFIRQILVISMISTSLYLVDCAPPETSKPDEQEGAITAEQAYQDSIRHARCDLYLSFAYSYYQNQDWRGAINNYKKMIKNGCEKEYAKDIFSYYGRAYQQLAATDPVYYDSALYVFQKGLEYLPNDRFLRENVAYIYHIQGKLDLEIREYEKMTEITPDDIELYKTLVRLYFSTNRYEDALWAIEKILRLNPNDSQALNDRMVVYNKLGRDPMAILEEQWNKNPTVANGLEYAAMLSDRFEYEKAIEVYKEVVKLSPRNREALENLGRLYTSLGKYEDAIEAYVTINRNIAPKDVFIIQEIVKAYIVLGEFENAYVWAEKAINTSESSLAYKLRGDVYFAAVEHCVAGARMTFEDKLVYKLSYDDYRKALELGDKSVKSRVDYLKEYCIPTKEDWFMNRYDAKGNLRKEFKPRKECYSWIKIEVKQD